MNFHHVRAFCTIVSEGSFSRAAERLHLTQPTISAQIQSLEKALSTRLFDRSAQGISLTQPGRVFHPYALQLLELSERAEQAMAELQGLKHGKVEVGASTVPGHYLMPQALAQFKAAHPGLDVTLTVSNSQDIRNGMREGRFELGVVGERVRDERLTYEQLAQDRLVVVMRPEHPLAERTSLRAEELLGEPLVMREHGSGTRAALERGLTAAGLSNGELRIFLELSSIEAIKLAIRSADALAVLSEWSVRDEARRGLLHLAALEGVTMERDFFLVRRAHGFLSMAGEAFLAFFKRYLKEHAGGE